MKRAMAMALIASTLLSGLANAQPAQHAATQGHGDGPTTMRTMDAPYIAAPVVRDGMLVNYLFISIRVEIQPGVDLWRTRERAQFLRDALVRAAHANQLAQANDTNALDQARAIQVFQAAAVQALGARAVGRVSIVATYSSRASAS